RRRRLARVAAVEDHVFHLVAAQALGALLAHHPRDRIGHVALAAPVRADNRRDAFVEGELGPIGKRFEAVDLETFKTHVRTKANCGLIPQSAFCKPRKRLGWLGDDLAYRPTNWPTLALVGGRDPHSAIRVPQRDRPRGQKRSSV